MDTAETQKRMQALLAQYQDRLLRQLDEMQALAAQLNGEAADQAVYAVLRERLHKLAGSGGTFGQPELGRRCLSLECLLDGWLAADAPPIDAGMRRQFLADLVALAGALA
ncbi:Hpt domain-containing protein [Chromobacterium sp. ASV23]|uniref:Hpt domain-containing protein n=1 Tax=Chromobacterium sp. ASV23 TaxID=2795110 RepID=UPI0018ED6A77|nr:Hpt domain-containing protein [Chromobacterium sp. ASV23]